MIGEIDEVVRKQAGSTSYIFGTVSSDKIKSLTFVPVIELSKKTFLVENVEDGYQRPGSPARMRAFSRFLKDHPNHVVPPVLLSARAGWHFVPNGPESDIGRIHVSEAAAIIDGQHRVGGFVALFEEHSLVRSVSFILLEGMTREEEMTEFVVVNNSQKGVPKSLTAYLEDSDEAQVAWGLNCEEDSPFKGRISRIRMETSQLFQLHSVARQIKGLFAFGALQDLDVPTKLEFAIRYWTIVADSLPDEWADIQKLDDPTSRGRRDFVSKLLELTGLIAWANTGGHILLRSYSAAIGMNWDNVRKLVDAVKVIDWDKDGQYRGLTGEVGGKKMSDDMIRLIPAEGELDETGGQ